MKLIAHIISIICHPLLMLTYGLLFMMWAEPYQFGSPSRGNILLYIMDRMMGMTESVPANGMSLYMISSIVGISCFFPAFSLLLMRGLGMVESLQLKDREERIIPYVSTGIFYLWLSVNIYKTTVFPYIFEVFAIGATIALFVAFFMNNFTKISLHTVGIGGFLAMVIFTMVNTSVPLYDLRPVLLGVIILAGLVGTARLILKAHIPQEIYGGYLVGVFGQFAAILLLRMLTS